MHELPSKCHPGQCQHHLPYLMQVEAQSPEPHAQ